MMLVPAKHHEHRGDAGACDEVTLSSTQALPHQLQLIRLPKTLKSEKIDK